MIEKGDILLAILMAVSVLSILGLMILAKLEQRKISRQIKDVHQMTVSNSEWMQTLPDHAVKPVSMTRK